MWCYDIHTCVCGTCAAGAAAVAVAAAHLVELSSSPLHTCICCTHLYQYAAQFQNEEEEENRNERIVAIRSLYSLQHSKCVHRRWNMKHEPATRKEKERKIQIEMKKKKEKKRATNRFE